MFRVYQPISSDIKTMKKQRDYIYVAHFLSSKDLPSLSEVFGRL